MISWQIPGENKARVSHRVVEVVKEGGNLSFRTKGDANEEPDKQLVAASSLTGRVIFRVPQAAKVTGSLEQRGLAFGLVLVCGVILIAMELEKVFRELRGGKKGPPRAGIRGRDPRLRITGNAEVDAEAKRFVRLAGASARAALGPAGRRRGPCADLAVAAQIGGTNASLADHEAASVVLTAPIEHGKYDHQRHPAG